MDIIWFNNYVDDSGNLIIQPYFCLLLRKLCCIEAASFLAVSFFFLTNINFNSYNFIQPNSEYSVTREISSSLPSRIARMLFSGFLNPS